MNVEEAKRLAQGRLSEKRFLHTKGVADCAESLANHYNFNPDFAKIAGYLHDLAKEESIEKMNEITSGIFLDDLTRSSRALLHGPAAAEFLKNEYNINEEIYDAVFYHTTGKENMPLLTKIVCLADYIEPNRAFDGLDEIRKTAETDIDEALIMSLSSTLEFVLKRGQRIHPNTILARNYLITNKV